MYIKSISLDGFKSYGHRTELTGWDPQFNAITGLNGSGKSNILDSICFVLGISNLTCVRANNLQELIYKSGQCGVTTASVTITFDNGNKEQSPVGFENCSEISISRQIQLGGKNKYLINGASVNNKKIQDLFCSVQLNVNNPNFLIMQGKITKVLNMKPMEILSMIEETCGTRMYEAKRQVTQKSIDKKEARLNDLKKLMTQELEPRLEKSRAERAKYLEFKSVERDLNKTIKIYQAWEFLVVIKQSDEAHAELSGVESKIADIHDKIASCTQEKASTENIIADIAKETEAEGNEDLKNAEIELKEAEKIQAKSNSALKCLTEEIKSEEKNKKQFEENIIEEQRTIETKQRELVKFDEAFKSEKDEEQAAKDSFNAAQKRFEALSAGLEVNEEGEAESLLQQIAKAEGLVVTATTEIQQAQMRIDYCKAELSTKTAKRSSSAADTARLKKDLDANSKEVATLEARVKKLDYDERTMNELNQNQHTLNTKIQQLIRTIEEVEMSRPQMKFRYRDPEANFNRSSVHGAVCRLFTAKERKFNYALEMAAGGRLYCVVVDTETTGKKLLANGGLQSRVTFIPLNKVKGSRMSQTIVDIAQNLEGADNVQLASDLITYDNKLHPVMEFVFGNILICKDIKIASRLAYDGRIRRKCVTLEGDVVDPGGTMSGGAPSRGGSILEILYQLKPSEVKLQEHKSKLEQVTQRYASMEKVQSSFKAINDELIIKKDDAQLILQRLQQSEDYRQQEQLTNLKDEINVLTQKIQTCIASQELNQKKIKELKKKLSDPKVGRDQQVREASKELQKLRDTLAKHTDNWKQREAESEIKIAEIEDLKKSVETMKGQVISTDQTIIDLRKKLEEANVTAEEINNNVSNLSGKVQEERSKIHAKNAHLQKCIKKKDDLQKEIVKYQLKIKEESHDLKKLKENVKRCKDKQTDLKDRVGDVDLKEADKITEQEGREMEKRIRFLQERKKVLSRTINTKLQNVLEQQEQELTAAKKKYRTVELDRNKLLKCIVSLDQKKKEILQSAYRQISKDFGSIFGTLLPGANAKLEPPVGQSVLQGLEVKVALGNVWKENLTELSGGQRSLAALSLILGMLLFKPAPLYILDEVDAALDLSHTQNVGQMLKMHFKKSQFIIVSLKDGMFNNANVLFKTQFVDGVSTVTRTVNRK